MTCPRGLRYVHTVIHTRNEWVGKYEEATVNIYKYFRRINIWRFPGNIRFVSWFFPREKKSCVSVPSIRETGRKVNEFPRVSVPSFTRDDHSRHEYALFDFPFWISPRETALNSVTRTSLELGYAMEGVNSIRGAHTHDIKKKKTLWKSIRAFTRLRFFHVMRSLRKLTRLIYIACGSISKPVSNFYFPSSLIFLILKLQIYKLWQLCYYETLYFKYFHFFFLFFF